MDMTLNQTPRTESLKNLLKEAFSLVIPTAGLVLYFIEKDKNQHLANVCLALAGLSLTGVFFLL